MAIGKLVATWTGFGGSPGYTTLYFANAQEAVFQPGAATFFDGIKGALTSAISITIPNTGMKLDETTGETNGTWTAGTVTTVVGTVATNTYASMAGAECRFDTNAFRRGHRVRGRIFLVPVATGVINNGVLTTAIANTIQVAGAGLMGKGLVIWHRPLFTKVEGGPPVLKEVGESLAPATATCPTKMVYLSSRRD